MFFPNWQQHDELEDGYESAYDELEEWTQEKHNSCKRQKTSEYSYYNR